MNQKKYWQNWSIWSYFLFSIFGIILNFLTYHFLFNHHKWTTISSSFGFWLFLVTYAFLKLLTLLAPFILIVVILYQFISPQWQAENNPYFCTFVLLCLVIDILAYVGAIFISLLMFDPIFFIVAQGIYVLREPLFWFITRGKMYLK